MNENIRARWVEQVWAAVAAMSRPRAADGHALATVTRDPATYIPVMRQQLAVVIRAMWDRGWLPYDTVRYLARQFDEPVLAVVGAVVNQEADRLMAAAPTDPWWRTSAADARVFTEALGRHGPPGVVAWLGLLAFVQRVPSLAVLAPVPGSPSPGRLRTARTTEGVDERQLERVRALLAKAESTTFAEEAEAFTAKAQELIARHSLHHVLTSVREVRGREEPVAIRVWFDDPYSDAKSVLLANAAAPNRCQAVFHPNLGCSTVFGFEHDLDAVELLFTSLLAQATGEMARHGSVRDADGRIRTKSFRRSFLYGFAFRIGERLRQVVIAEAVEADRAAGGALVPVLAELEAQVEAAQRAVFPRTGRQPTSVTNGQGWFAGKVAADRARLGPTHSLTG